MSKIIDLKDALVTKAFFSKENDLSIPNINYKVKIGTYTEIAVNGCKLLKVGEHDMLKHIDFSRVYTSAEFARKIGVFRQTIKNNQSDYFVIKVKNRDLFYLPKGS